MEQGQVVLVITETEKVTEIEIAGAVETDTVLQLDQPQVQSRKRLLPLSLPKMLLIVGLLGLAFVLCGCDSTITTDPPCAGANANAPGCTNPVTQPLTDKDDSGGEWYIGWAFNIIRNFEASIATFFVKLGVYVFWQIFTNLASTNFASCSAGPAANPTCDANEVFGEVMKLAFGLFGLIISWKIFKSYFIGATVDQAHESAFSFVTKIILGALGIGFMTVLFSGAFGLSDLLFLAITGGPQGLQEIASNLVGTNNQGGVNGLTQLKSLGLLSIDTLICLVLAIEFVILGITFLLRTVLIFIYFASGPLAVLAVLTEEFRPWFNKWLSGVQGLLVAPLPVAIAIRMVKSFAKLDQLNAAASNPAQFVLNLVYIGCFLLIAAILQFKIAGSVGGFVFGLAVGVASNAGGYAAGRLMGAGLARGGTGAGSGSTAGSNEPGIGSSSGTGSGFWADTEDLANRALPALPGGGSRLALPFPGNGPTPFSGSSYGTAGPAAGTSFNSGFSDSAGMERMTKVISGLNENFAALSMNRSTTAFTASVPGSLENQSAGNQGYAEKESFHYGAARNLHHSLLWMGQEAGVSAPYISFAPSYQPNVSRQSNQPGSPANLGFYRTDESLQYQTFKPSASGSSGEGGGNWSSSSGSGPNPNQPSGPFFWGDNNNPYYGGSGPGPSNNGGEGSSDFIYPARSGPNQNTGGPVLWLPSGYDYNQQRTQNGSDQGQAGTANSTETGPPSSPKPVRPYGSGSAVTVSGGPAQKVEIIQTSSSGSGVQVSSNNFNPAGNSKMEELTPSPQSGVNPVPKSRLYTNTNNVLIDPWGEE